MEERLLGMLEGKGKLPHSSSKAQNISQEDVTSWKNVTLACDAHWSQTVSLK